MEKNETQDMHRRGLGLKTVLSHMQNRQNCCGRKRVAKEYKL